MAKDSEVQLDKKQDFISITPSVKIDLDLGVDKIITDLKRIQREAKNATQAIKEMEFVKDNFHEDDELSVLLDLVDKYGFLLTSTNENKSRGIGKTHALVKKAMKENLIILEPISHHVDYIRNTFNFDGVINVNGYQSGSNKLRYAKGFLVDDMVSVDAIEEFMRSNPHLPFKGGFLTDSTTVRLNHLQLEKEY